MLQMFRRLSPLILLVAVLIAAEPLLHSHPLESASGRSGSAVCAICATGTGRLPTVIVMLGVPQLIEQTYAIVAPAIVAADVPLPRSPRAPPAA